MNDGVTLHGAMSDDKERFALEMHLNGQPLAHVIFDIAGLEITIAQLQRARAEMAGPPADGNAQAIAAIYRNAALTDAQRRVVEQATEELRLVTKVLAEEFASLIASLSDKPDLQRRVRECVDKTGRRLDARLEFLSAKTERKAN